MKNIYVKDLAKGMSLTFETFAVKDVQMAETKNGKPYYKVILIDKTGDVFGQIWSDNIPNIEKSALKTGKVVAIDATVEEYKGNIQLNINKVSAVDETALEEYLEASDFDLEVLWKELLQYVDKITDAKLKSFLTDVLTDKEVAAKYKVNPAAEFIHHSFHGGLLEHVVEMLDLAQPLRKYYSEINFDLVTAGIILHDIGKIFELEVVGTVVQRTKEGYLLGHLIKSYELLLEKSKNKLDEETILCLKHIILSHHGLQEYGSPVVPATIEAAVVHAVDEVSTRVRIFQKLIRKNNSTGEEFTQWDKILGTRVYLPKPEDQINLI